MNVEDFTAADYEESAVFFFFDAEFELSRLALIQAKSMREDGDDSVKPTPFTQEDYEEAAGEWDASGNHLLAAAARNQALLLQSE